MTTSDPVDRVVAFLERHGYRRLPAPLMINRVVFRFPAVLGGAERSSDLILVADTVGAEDAEIVRHVLGVARALDVARSSNPLTTVIVGPRPNQDSMTQMMAVCRVLPLGTVSDDDGEQELANWLAVLTPLNQVDHGGVVADPIAELKQHLHGLPQEIADLVTLADAGADRVSERVYALLVRELEHVWEAGE